MTDRARGNGGDGTRREGRDEASDEVGVDVPLVLGFLEEEE